MSEERAVVAAQRQARDRALEEAAKLCDQTHQTNLHSVGISMGSDMRAMTAYKLAQQIRTLKDQP